MKVSLGDVIPFPAAPGIYIRLVWDNKAGGVAQGHILRFEGDKVIDASNGNIASPEILLAGDHKTNNDTEHDYLVTYSLIRGLDVKPAALAQKQPKNIQPHTGL